MHVRTNGIGGYGVRKGGRQALSETGRRHHAEAVRDYTQSGRVKRSVHKLPSCPSPRTLRPQPDHSDESGARTRYLPDNPVWGITERSQVVTASRFSTIKQTCPRLPGSEMAVYAQIRAPLSWRGASKATCALSVPAQAITLRGGLGGMPAATRKGMRTNIRHYNNVSTASTQSTKTETSDGHRGYYMLYAE